MKYLPGFSGISASKTSGAAIYKIMIIRNKWIYAEMLVKARPRYNGTPVSYTHLYTSHATNNGFFPFNFNFPAILAVVVVLPAPCRPAIIITVVACPGSSLISGAYTHLDVYKRQILISSIRAGLTMPIPVAMAFSIISSYNSSRLFSESFFESFR